jgi:NADH:ubiquinone reductase (non-electrogenic)
MKKKIILLGTGFAAYRFLKKIAVKKYDIIVVSPRNHFLFTPLLPSTTVGTIEFRSIIEPIRNIKGIKFIQSECININSVNNKILCRDSDTSKEYELSFDKLIIAVGETTNTFGLEGVREHSLFLKELSDARRIRTKVIDCFENASLPEISGEEKKNYIRFVVCGGGPTGVEFAAELHDFIKKDIKKRYSQLAEKAEIIIIEAKEEILSVFDKKLIDYTTKLFNRQKIIVRTNTYIKDIKKKTIILSNNEKIDYGLLVWATGNTSMQLLRKTEFKLTKQGKVITDAFLKVKNYDNIYAIGDCSEIENNPLPVTAQVAQQQGLFLAKLLNGKNKNKKFSYKNLGMLAYVGSDRALADLPQYKGRGFIAFLLWRSAYLTKLVSFKNKILVLFDWVKTFLFGRDVSNF